MSEKGKKLKASEDSEGKIRICPNCHTRAHKCMAMSEFGVHWHCDERLPSCPKAIQEKDTALVSRTEYQNLQLIKSMDSTEEG